MRIPLPKYAHAKPLIHLHLTLTQALKWPPCMDANTLDECREICRKQRGSVFVVFLDELLKILRPQTRMVRDDLFPTTLRIYIDGKRGSGYSSLAYRFAASRYLAEQDNQGRNQYNKFLQFAENDQKIYENGVLVDMLIGSRQYTAPQRRLHNMYLIVCDVSKNEIGTFSPCVLVIAFCAYCCVGYWTKSWKLHTDLYVVVCPYHWAMFSDEQDIKSRVYNFIKISAEGAAPSTESDTGSSTEADAKHPQIENKQGNIAIVATKTDVDGCKERIAQVKELAERMLVAFYSTSAKQEQGNVKEMFHGFIKSFIGCQVIDKE